MILGQLKMGEHQAKCRALVFMYQVSIVINSRSLILRLVHQIWR